MNSELLRVWLLGLLDKIVGACESDELSAKAREALFLQLDNVSVRAVARSWW